MSDGQFGNLAEVFHKESSKENKRPKALSLKDKSFSRVAKQSPKRNSESDEGQKSQAQKVQTRLNARRNAEIDDFLIALVMEGIIDEDYWKFHTKCVYTLGLDRYNTLLIEARAGRTPKNLFAFKLKGALELHYKKQIYKSENGY
jgi:hypothetical protein